MDYEAWQLKRRALQDIEKAERSINWTQSRAPIQAAITEQAVRELYDQFEGLRQFAASIEARVCSMENTSRELGQYKRGPGRPPKEAE